MVGVGRPVTCRINGCGGLQVAHGGRTREAEEEGRSPKEDHTAPPRATEPRATVARCQPHLPTTAQRPEKNQKKPTTAQRKKSSNLKTLSLKQI